MSLAEGRGRPRASEIDRYLGARIRAARSAAGWSMATLSQRLEPPVTWQQFQKYETGRNRLSACRLWEIARLLGLSPLDLLPAETCPDSASPAMSADELKLIAHFRCLSKDQKSALSRLLDTMVSM